MRIAYKYTDELLKIYRKNALPRVIKWSVRDCTINRASWLSSRANRERRPLIYENRCVFDICYRRVQPERIHMRSKHREWYHSVTAGRQGEESQEKEFREERL